MKTTPSPLALDVVEKALSRKAREPKRKKVQYAVPSLWLTDKGAPKAVNVDPYTFFLGAVRKCKRVRPPRTPKPTGGEWSKDAVIYNMFVRTAAAFDHNGNGKLDLPANADGFRETGTFLKAIAMLPYIKRLGATAIHLLPITSIGHDGNKGSLGSPYAIRNPYELDENLAEPALGLDAKTEFKAFVEAAHRMGLRVVVEFVFRTAAKDGDWVKEHPEWFYWIREDVPLRKSGEQDGHSYGSPIFSREELHRIHDDVNNGRFGNLPEPHHGFKGFFTEPPSGEHVHKEDGRYAGILPDGRRVKIPGAFADWPPDDNQPPWNDVTYLRMYTNPDFNYIAYNTIRMYDARLAQHQYINRPLWERIVGIIPYYEHEFGIDGVMIDMGHALPKELKSEMVRSSRETNHDFAFWDENFAISQKSRDEGYNAVFGYLWHIQHEPNHLRDFMWRLHNETLAVPFFASAESHNTHRAAARKGGVCYSHWTLYLNMFMPAIPFIHSGYELAEEYPINTGLDFTGEELQHMPSETLPLFSEFAYDWMRNTEFSGLLAKVLKIRKKYHALIVNPDHTTFRFFDVPNHAILAYSRISEMPKKRLAIVTNSNCEHPEHAVIHFETGKKLVTDQVTGKRLKITDGSLDVTLQPGQGLVFEY